MKKTIIVSVVAIFFIVVGVLIASYRIHRLATTPEIFSEKPQEIPQPQEIFEAYYDKANALLETMSLEEEVGQLFLARCPSEGAVEQVIQEHPGGFVLFGNDFKGKTKEEIEQTITSYQQASTVPMIIGVDEEGGSVVRISHYSNFRSQPFGSPREVFHMGGYAALETEAKEKADLLLALGINLNLAPVADVPTSSESFIYERSFGTDPEATATFVRKMVIIFNEKKIGSTLKHFPGYGDNGDSHEEIILDKRSKETLEQRDFIPFRAGIEAEVPSILVAHNIVESIDSTRPASISKPVHEILRKELEFSGIIMTDDTAMKGLTNYTDGGSAAVLAVKAGNDMIISSDFVHEKEAVLQAVEQGVIDRDTLRLAVKRILAYKYKMGLIVS